LKFIGLTGEDPKLFLIQEVEIPRQKEVVLRFTGRTTSNLHKTAHLSI